MLNTSGFSISFIPGHKTVYRDNYPNRNLTIDIISGEGYSYPADSSIEINSYIYLAITINQLIPSSKGGICIGDLLSIVNNKEMERFFRSVSNNLYINNLQFSPDAIESITNILKEYVNNDLPQLCCKCGLMDHWNSKNNNKWYCYKHCSF